MLEHVAGNHHIVGVRGKRQWRIGGNLMKVEIHGRMRCADIDTNQPRLGSYGANELQVLAFARPIVEQPAPPAPGAS